jgi:hypothetical protein
VASWSSARTTTAQPGLRRRKTAQVAFARFTHGSLTPARQTRQTRSFSARLGSSLIPNEIFGPSSNLESRASSACATFSLSEINSDISFNKLVFVRPLTRCGAGFRCIRLMCDQLACNGWLSRAQVGAKGTEPVRRAKGQSGPKLRRCWRERSSGLTKRATHSSLAQTAPTTQAGLLAMLEFVDGLRRAAAPPKSPGPALQ